MAEGNAERREEVAREHKVWLHTSPGEDAFGLVLLIPQSGL